MANILVTTNRTHKRGVKRKTLSEHIYIGATSLTIILVLFTAVVSVIYLLYANKNATNGYQFQQLQRDRKELILSGEKFDMLIAQSKSLESLRNDERVAHMVKAKKAIFMRGDTAVARK